jgi:hypothetical protein
MATPTAYPLNLTHAAAVAHLAELRAEAETHRIRRAATRRHVVWPTTVARALRDSLVSTLPTQRRTSRACATC